MPAESVATYLNAKIYAPEDFPELVPEQVLTLLTSETWSAAVVCQNPLQILLHPRCSPARRESNLMHELAHVLLKHPMATFDPVTGLPERSIICENEATYLGGCLQVPRRGMLWALQRGLSMSQAAVHFGASEEMIDFRSNVTGVKLNCL